MATETTFYHPGNSWFEPDGTLAVCVSRFIGSPPSSTARYGTGVCHFVRDDPDYPLWCHLAERFKKNPPSTPFVSSDELPVIREKFALEGAATHEV
jgi:hypothetical protein